MSSFFFRETTGNGFLTPNEKAPHVHCVDAAVLLGVTNHVTPTRTRWEEYHTTIEVVSAGLTAEPGS